MPQITEASSSKPVGRRRYAVMLLLLMLVTINYMDRANLAIAGPQIAHEFGWGPGVLGVVFSALFWVYPPGLLLWGALLDLIGTRVAYAAGLLIWSLASVFTGTITGLGSLLGARIALGVGESVMPSGSAKVVREWSPARERGLATGMFTAGYYAGPAIGFPICAWLAAALGWRAMFYALGSLSLLFFVVWLIVYQRPEKAKWLGRSERDMIVAERDSAALRASMPSNVPMTRRQLLRHPTTWGLVIAQASSTYTQYLFLTWLPGYLLHSQGLSLTQAGGWGSLPYVVALVASIAFGWYTDRRLSGGARDRGGRRIYVVVSMIASTAILLVPLAHNFGLVIGLMAISLAGSGCTLTTNVSLAHDMLVEPKVAGLLFGTLGLGSNCLALFSPVITGLVVQHTNEFSGAFIVAGVLSVIGILCVLLLVRKPISPPAATERMALAHLN